MTVHCDNVPSGGCHCGVCTLHAHFLGPSLTTSPRHPPPDRTNLAILDLLHGLVQAQVDSRVKDAEVLVEPLESFLTMGQDDDVS